MAFRYCDELWNLSNCLTSNDWENFAFGRSGRHFCSCWLDENLETMADFSFFGQFRPMFCRRPWLWFFLNLPSNDEKSRIWEMKCKIVDFNDETLLLRRDSNSTPGLRKLRSNWVCLLTNSSALLFQNLWSLILESQIELTQSQIFSIMYKILKVTFLLIWKTKTNFDLI